MDRMGFGITQPARARGTPPLTERVPPGRVCRPRWRPRAVSVAVLVTASAVVAITAVGTSDIICGQRQNRTTSPPPAPPTPSLPTSGVASATCAAWPPTKRSIDAVSALPAGWYWNPSTARTDVTDMAAAVNLDLDHFHSQIATTDPARPHLRRRRGRGRGLGPFGAEPGLRNTESWHGDNLMSVGGTPSLCAAPTD
jgi:hypothetical protein